MENIIHDFLYTYYELNELSSDRESWSLDILEYSPPRHIRLQKLITYQTLYNIGDIKKFEKLEFLDVSNYNINVVKQILKKYNQDYLAEEFINNKEVKYIWQKLFQSLLKIYISVLDVSHNFSGWLAMSPPLTAVYLLNRDISDGLLRKTLVVGELLEYMLNPFQIKYSKKELIDLYGYPTEDLDKVDLDWI